VLEMVSGVGCVLGSVYIVFLLPVVLKYGNDEGWAMAMF
jgi:hypothetical protein